MRFLDAVIRSRCASCVFAVGLLFSQELRGALVPLASAPLRYAALGQSEPFSPAGWISRLPSPVLFEHNTGQIDFSIVFRARHDNYLVYFTYDEVVFSFVQASLVRQELLINTLSMKFVGANLGFDIVGEQPVGLEAALLWRDFDRLESALDYGSKFRRLRYRNVYDGVDVVFYGKGVNLEYDFVVAPGAAVDAIRLAFTGVDQIRVDKRGNLVLNVGGHEIVHSRPKSYQHIDGEDRLVDSEFVIGENNEVSVKVGAYDTTYELIIDPVVGFSTVTGGDADDRVHAVAVDPSGNTVVVGQTSSARFPVTTGVLQAEHAGGLDGFVARFSPRGELISATYVGGSGDDIIHDVAVDQKGGVYIVGETQSVDWPLVRAWQSDFANSPTMGFVARITPALTTLEFSTLLGGSGVDRALAVAVDARNAVYVGGVTTSGRSPTEDPAVVSFPVTANAFDQDCGSDGFCDRDAATGTPVSDGFVAKLSADGTRLVFASFLGGSGPDAVADLDIDAANAVYVAGATRSVDFPVSSGAFDAFCGVQACEGGDDGFLSKFGPSGERLEYSTYWGGTGEDRIAGLAVDAVGFAYIVGESSSVDLPLFEPVQAAPGGGWDGFAAKLDRKAADVLYATYIGGRGDDRLYQAVLGDSGHLYVIGITDSDDLVQRYPLTTPGGGGDLLIAGVDPEGRTYRFSTTFGGSDRESGAVLGRGQDERLIAAAGTRSHDFPQTIPEVDRERSPETTGGIAVMALEPRTVDLGVGAVSLQQDPDVAYAISVVNRGPGAVDAVTLTVTPLPEVVISTISPGQFCTQDSAGVVTCRVDRLAEGEIRSYELIAFPAQTPAPFGFSARVSAFASDANPEDNQASVGEGSVTAPAGEAGGGRPSVPGEGGFLHWATLGVLAAVYGRRHRGRETRNPRGEGRLKKAVGGGGP